MAKKSIWELVGPVTRFGRLTVVGEGNPILGAGHPARCARCVCDCGGESHVQPAKLKTGKYLSCGCWSAEQARIRFTKHGGHNELAYRSYAVMLQRCTKPDSAGFEQYAGRGITIADRWLGEGGYEQFRADMGPRPKGTTLERIENGGNYEPGNCRWATPKEQARNRRDVHLVEVDGQTYTHIERSVQLGLSKNAVSERLRRGWALEEAISTPRYGKRKAA